MIVQVITVRLVQTQNHGNLRPADGAPARLLFQLGDARRTESLMPTRHKHYPTLRTYPTFTRTQLAAKSGALSCRLMHSCSAMDRNMQHAVFHTIAFLAFSCLAFSTPATWCRIFMSRNFMSRIFSVPCCTSAHLCEQVTQQIKVMTDGLV